MQKDFIVKKIGTIKLDTTGTQTPVIIDHIKKTVIFTATGRKYTINGGYLDIGIIDTMKDLLVNCIGAVVFSIAGYFYEKARNLSSKKNPLVNVAPGLMITALSDEDLRRQEEEILARQTAIAEEKKRRRLER